MYAGLARRIKHFGKMFRALSPKLSLQTWSDVAEPGTRVYGRAQVPLPNELPHCLPNSAPAPINDLSEALDEALRGRGVLDGVLQLRRDRRLNPSVKPVLGDRLEVAQAAQAFGPGEPPMARRGGAAEGEGLVEVEYWMGARESVSARVGSEICE